MIFKSKRNIIDCVDPILNGRTHYVIIKDKVYKGEYTTKTYQPGIGFKDRIIVTCEDGKTRHFNKDDFFSLEEWREFQLDKIIS